MTKEKRKRENRVCVRFTDDELAELNKKALYAGMNRESFIRDSLANEKIFGNEYKETIRDLVWQLQRVGNNLNQVLKMFRVEGITEKRILELENVKAEISDVVRQISQNAFKEK